jgi:hypothetical protein
MKKHVSWTDRLDDGVKRETRVHVHSQHMKWQFKRSDEDAWDYDSPPTPEDWDCLEDILRRRAGRGRAVNLLDNVRKMRAKSGA